jgi:hypothetical protein
MWENSNIAQYYIPEIINKLGNALLTDYSFSPELVKASLFFNYLFQNPNIAINYDSFNFIPLNRNEIVGLVVCANTFETILSGKIYLSSFHIKYIP